MKKNVTYRTDTIYLYSFTSPFVAECLGRLKYGALACCVGRNVVVGNERDYACNVDDFTRSFE